MKRMMIVAMGVLLAISVAEAQSPAPAEYAALAHDVFKQLIEINTTDSVGNVTTAAEAMAKRLREAGFEEKDIQIAGHATTKRILWFATAAMARESQCFSSGTSTWWRRAAKTGASIHFNFLRRMATFMAGAPRT